MSKPLVERFNKNGGFLRDALISQAFQRTKKNARLGKLFEKSLFLYDEKTNLADI